MRPPAPARRPAHTHLCRWIVFEIDHWSGAELSHPNFLTFDQSFPTHAAKSLIETQATVMKRYRQRFRPVNPARFHFPPNSSTPAVVPGGTLITGHGAR